MNAGERASILYPPPAVSFLEDAVTVIGHRSVTGGEEYAVNCRFCKDRKHRLVFHYLWDADIYAGTIHYKCSNSLVQCFNEQCQSVPENHNSLVRWVRQALTKDNTVAAAEIQATEDGEDENSLKNQVPLPPNLLDIDSPNLPYYVRNYWLGTDKEKGERGFTAQHLRDFGIRFTYLPFAVKLGAPLCQQMVSILPVHQNGDYWFFQIRMIPIQGDIRNGYETDQFGEQLPKYIIPKGSRKNWALYNIDRARYYNTVYVVEGITDVMRIGPSAIARFGKTLSHAQFTQMNRLLAGKEIVIIPDMDDPEAVEHAVKQKAMLENTGNFRKVTMIRLPGNIDPGDLEGGHDEVCQYLKELTDLQELTTQSLCGNLAIV